MQHLFGYGGDWTFAFQYIQHSIHQRDAEARVGVAIHDTNALQFGFLRCDFTEGDSQNTIFRVAREQ